MTDVINISVSADVGWRRCCRFCGEPAVITAAIPVADAFQEFGLVSESIHNWDDTIDKRVKALIELQSDIERYVFLHDLKHSHAVLFDAVLRRHPPLLTLFLQVSRFMSADCVVGVVNHFTDYKKERQNVEA